MATLMESAKARLMLEHPLLGSVASRLRLQADEKTLTFQSDGETLKYNPEYLEMKAQEYEVLFALANGALHAMFEHKVRAGNRVPRLWRAAADLVVNAILVKNGFTLPADAYYDETYENMYVEEVYDRLIQDMHQNDTLDEPEEGESPMDDNLREPKETEKNKKDNTQHKSNSPLSHSDDATIHDDVEADESDDMSTQYELLFEKFLKREELPQGLEYLVSEWFSNSIDWREALYRYIADFAKNTYRFSPPNVKHLYRGVALPASASDLLRIVIVIDTSGSVDDTLVRIFLGEVQSIMQIYGNYEIDLLLADERVRMHRTYLPGESLSTTVVGRGGTDFRAAFDYIQRHIDYPSAVLYFTDGQGIFPDDAPAFDVLWIMPEEREVPFGEKLIVNVSK